MLININLKKIAIQQASHFWERLTLNHSAPFQIDYKKLNKNL